jgi:hypothetical protein
MLYINQSQLTQVPATCSRNNINGGGVYLWEMIHKLTGQYWSFIPYRIPPITTYQPGYDLFCITVDDTQPESLTGNTVCGDCNVHLIPGEYWVRIYSQTSTTNLFFAFADELVYETIGNVVGVNQNEPVTYSGTSDIFIVYNEDND